MRRHGDSAGREPAVLPECKGQHPDTLPPVCLLKISEYRGYYFYGTDERTGIGRIRRTVVVRRESNMKKTTILTMLLAVVLAISPLGVFAANEGAADEPAQAAEAVIDAETGADADADIEAAEEQTADEEAAYEQAEVPEEDLLSANPEYTVTPGNWNEGRTQYIGEDGQAVTGFFVAEKKAGGEGLYYADDSGIVLGSTSTAVGLVDRSSSQYYILSNGYWVKASKAHKYYINNKSDPYMAEESKVYGGSSKYFVTEEGFVRTKKGIVTDENDDKWFVKSGGAIRTNQGFQKTDAGYVYYVRDGGKIRTEAGAFKAASDSKYHMLRDDESGHVIVSKGFHTYDGKRYYCTGKSNGVLATNQLLTVKNNKGKTYRYHINSKAVVLTGLHTWKNNKYFASDKGALYTQGIRTHNNKKYYIKNNEGRVAVKEKFSYKNNTYFASKDGHLLSGVIHWYDGKYYYCYEGCALMTKKAIFKYDGKWYSNKSGGGLQTDAFITNNYKHYYAGSNAAFKTSAFTYSGHTINPNHSTGEISFSDWNAIHGNRWKYYEYVQVSISGQSLYYYLNGEIYVKSSILSGMYNQTDTRKGSFKVKSKKTNVTATYNDKNFNIEYWVHYYNSSNDEDTMAIGDAPLGMSTFGGSYYKTAGSNGEILVPYNVAKTIYNKISVNTPIIIQ